VNVARAAYKADPGSHAGKNLAGKQLPICSGKCHAKVSQRHPNQGEKQHALGTETVDDVSARKLHACVCGEDAGGQEPGERLIEAELSHEGGGEWRMIRVICGVGECDDASTQYGNILTRGGQTHGRVCGSAGNL